MTKAENDITGFSDEKLGELLTAKLRPMEPISTDIMQAGSLKGPLRSILFDVYGTLFISAAGDINVARKAAFASKEFRALLHRFDITTPPEKVLESYFSGIRKEHQKAKQQGVDYPEVQIDRIWADVLGSKDISWAKRFSLEFELMANPVYPMPHLETLLAHCRNASLAMGIISNAQFYTPLLFQWFMKEEPAALGFEKDLLIYSYQLGCAKPSPALFNLAAARLEKRRISPEFVLYVGNDLGKDIIPAKRAGFQTALFAGDARSLRLGGRGYQSNDIEADLVITDLRQLLPQTQNIVGRL